MFRYLCVGVLIAMLAQRVRIAEAADAAAIQGIFERALRSADWLPEGAEPDCDFKRNAAGETVLVCVSEDGQVRGFLSVYAGGAFVHHLYVDAPFQRQGVGAALLAWLDGWLPKPWRLKCVAANTAARAFYARRGWIETEHNLGSQGPYIVLRCGPPAPAKIQPMKTIQLRAGKERSLLRRHPWVFQGSIAKGGGDAGETVRVESQDGRFLAWAAFSPSSQIRLRAWSFDEGQRIDEAFFDQRLRRAVALRERLAIASDGVRLVHGEADGLPGLIVDRYGDVLSAQFLAAGTERWRDVIAERLMHITGVQRLYERSDASVRSLEGLPLRAGWMHGGAEGEAGNAGDCPPGDTQAGDTEVTITEHGWSLGVDVAKGHKTGYYLDQRDNRRRFAELVRQLGCLRVLNCYSYSGGFSVAALAGGASSVLSVDSSGAALQLARRNILRNGFDLARCEFVDADVNQTLREALKAGQRFDAIVLDPPKFAASAAHAERAARAYKDINRLALMLLSPGGLLMSFSCSGGIGAELFHKIVAGAGIDANVDGALIQRLEAAPDHPTTICFPEGEYLKGLAIIRQ